MWVDYYWVLSSALPCEQMISPEISKKKKTPPTSKKGGGGVFEWICLVSLGILKNFGDLRWELSEGIVQQWVSCHDVELNHSHDVQYNRGEDGCEHAIRDETKASESSVFSSIFHGTWCADSVRGGTHAQTLCNGALDTTYL